MKTFIHEYKGNGVHPSKCKVYINEVGTQTWVGFQNIEGTSVTNASEQIATEVVENLLLNPLNCKFFEWYPEDGMVSEVAYLWKGPIASQAEWAYYCEGEYNPFLKGGFPFEDK